MEARGKNWRKRSPRETQSSDWFWVRSLFISKSLFSQEGVLEEELLLFKDMDPIADVDPLALPPMCW